MSAWVEEQPTENLLCRDTGIRHQWEPYIVDKIGGKYIETLECRRCGSEKERTLSATGLCVRTRMRYAEGFLRDGLGRMTKAENGSVRLEAMKRRYSL